MFTNNIYPSLAINIVSHVNAIPNVLHFVADVSGCSLYRMKMPEYLLNYNGKANIQTLNKMITQPEFFTDVDVIRLQRQVTPAQLKYIEYLKSIQPKNKFRIIYEIDDIPYADDIPLYNIARPQYDKPEVVESINKILQLIDEMTVTCPFMKQYFKNKGVKNVTVIPNFLARFWADNLYDQSEINRNYDTHKKKPRVLYCGSNAHYDLTNNNRTDDTSHIINNIINTINDFEWVFLGGYPKKLEPYVKSKKIEFHPWAPITSYTKYLKTLGVQAAIAPLADNTFNKAKSNIKWTEMCALGIPCVCQNLCTYEDAWWKFDTGDEMIEQLKNILNKPSYYKSLGPKLHALIDNLWLDNPDNLSCYEELYKYPYGSPERKNLNRFNNE